MAQHQLVGYSCGTIIAARLLELDPHVRAAVLGGMGEAFTSPNWPRRIAFYQALSGEKVSPELGGFVQSLPAHGLDKQTLAWQQQAQPSTSAAPRVHIQVLVISGADDHGTSAGFAHEVVGVLAGRGHFHTVGAGLLAGSCYLHLPLGHHYATVVSQRNVFTGGGRSSLVSVGTGSGNFHNATP